MTWDRGAEMARHARLTAQQRCPSADGAVTLATRERRSLAQSVAEPLEGIEHRGEVFVRHVQVRAHPQPGGAHLPRRTLGPGVGGETPRASSRRCTARTSAPIGVASIVIDVGSSLDSRTRQPPAPASRARVRLPMAASRARTRSGPSAWCLATARLSPPVRRCAPRATPPTGQPAGPRAIGPGRGPAAAVLPGLAAQQADRPRAARRATCARCRRRRQRPSRHRRAPATGRRRRRTRHPAPGTPAPSARPAATARCDCLPASRARGPAVAPGAAASGRRRPRRSAAPVRR